MTTSGNYTLTVTLIDILEDAFDILQIGADGESLSADMLKRGKNTLNIMLKGWETQGIHLWSYTEGTLFLKVGQSEYDFSTANLANTWYETSTTTDGIAGFNTFTVEDGTNIEVDDKIGIILDNNDLFFSTVSTITSISSYDISTTVYSGNSFYVGNEDASSIGLRFDNNGNSMFITGSFTSSVYEYTLSTPYDILTAIYSGNSLDINNEDSSPATVIFDSSGLFMTVVGGQNATLFVYNLTIAYDISTAIYSGNSFYVGNEDIDPVDIDFNKDGTIFLLLGNSTDSVYEYTLSTPYDISTAIYSGNSFFLGNQNTNIKSFRISSEGDTLVVVGSVNQSATLYSYSLSTGFDISTATYSNINYYVGIQDSEPRGIEFNNDGTLLYMLGNNTSTVYSYDLTNNEKTITISDSINDSFSIGNAVRNYRENFIPVSRILNVRRQESDDYEIPIVFESRKDYFNLPNKNQLGLPIQAYYSRQEPAGIMYLWTSPINAISVINFTYERQLQIMEDNNNTFDFPSEWTEAITYNLALRLIPKYGCSSERTQFIKLMADNALQQALSFDTAIYPITVNMERHG